jgi:hypothetical protein
MGLGSAFVIFIHKLSIGCVICLETYHPKKQKCHFLSTDCMKINSTKNLFYNAIQSLYYPLITQCIVHKERKRKSKMAYIPQSEVLQIFS